MKNFDSYYDPPDDDPICEDGCGETLVKDFTGVWLCGNRFCPLRFQGTEREMAYQLVDVLDSLRTYKSLYGTMSRNFEIYKKNHP